MRPLTQAECTAVRAGFSDYLDGAVSGVEMAAIGDHLGRCPACAEEFSAWRGMQLALAELGPAQPPRQLYPRLRSAVAQERERGTHLPLLQRALNRWTLSIAPIALRVSGGLAAALVLAGGMAYLFAAPIAVQANDDRMANLVGPRFLYSEVPPQPVEPAREIKTGSPVVVEALVDTRGRVYDYTILEGPQDPAIRAHLELDLLASVYQPASVLGTPVRGHVLLTFTDVAVHG
jgi:anti-sigma factor RsiW